MASDRRAFLRYLLATPLAGLVSKLPIAGPKQKQFLLNEFHIAGFRYYDGLEIVGRLRAGQGLSLSAEPGNPHDAFAVEIACEGRKLGYVPRTDNRHISRLLRQDAWLACQVVQIDAEEPPWRMVKVKVSLLV